MKKIEAIQFGLNLTSAGSEALPLAGEADSHQFNQIFAEIMWFSADIEADEAEQCSEKTAHLPREKVQSKIDARSDYAVEIAPAYPVVLPEAAEEKTTVEASAEENGMQETALIPEKSAGYSQSKAAEDAIPPTESSEEQNDVTTGVISLSTVPVLFSEAGGLAAKEFQPGIKPEASHVEAQKTPLDHKAVEVPVLTDSKSGSKGQLFDTNVPKGEEPLLRGELKTAGVPDGKHSFKEEPLKFRGQSEEKSMLTQEDQRKNVFAGIQQLVEGFSEQKGMSIPAALETRVINPIVKGIQLQSTHKDGVDEIRVRLQPESLGEVTIKISREDGLISGRIIVESILVKEVLENRLPLFKERLAEVGIELKEMHVSLGSNTGNDSGAGLPSWKIRSGPKIRGTMPEMAEHDGPIRITQGILDILA